MSHENSTTSTSKGKGFKYFRKRLHEEILRSQRCLHTFTLMCLSVDAIENNNTDEQLNTTLKGAIREYDLLCTIKPAEYFIAFPETNEHHAELIAERIRDRIHEEGWKEQMPISVEANIGIACFPHDGKTTEDLLLSAEHDLKQARIKRRQ